MTIGEDRVRIKFNPSSVNAVDVIKQKSAELIDLCEQQKQREYTSSTGNAEVNRLWSLAQTYYETAAMYAVKGATY